jgi:FkbM family methyltransferase
LRPWFGSSGPAGHDDSVFALESGWYPLPVSRPRIRLASAKVRKLVRLLGNRAYWPALRQGVAASVEHSVIPFGENFATVLDVGASRGQFALFSRANFPNARIICFEPQPGPAGDLRRVLGGRVELIGSALGPEKGEAEMNVSARDDSSSLRAIGDRQVAEFPGTQTDHSIRVPVTTLDDVLELPLERPCLLKIDVQGFELDVLRGGANTLQQVDVALIECSFIELYEGQALAEEVVTFMRQAGFRLAGVHGIAYSADGSAIQADFLYRRAEA